jgi:hypothetical protein
MIELTALDRLEIIELQSIYAWGIDGRDGASFALAFSDDVEAQYTKLGTMRGLEFFTNWMNAFHAPFDATQHLISNHWLRVDGDEVVMRSYVIAHILKRGCPGGDIFNGGGYYTDRVVRTDAGWRIRARAVVNFWRGGNPDVIALGREAVSGIAP